MSLLAVATLLAASATSASASQPAHTVSLAHRGSTYTVDYRPTIETNSRTIGMAVSSRPSTQRCVMTARVSVERSIADGGHALTSPLDNPKTFTRQVPGACGKSGTQLAKFMESKAGDIDNHLLAVVAGDKQAAIAAIDAAHHFAAN